MQKRILGFDSDMKGDVLGMAQTGQQELIGEDKVEKQMSKSEKWKVKAEKKNAEPGEMSVKIETVSSKGGVDERPSY